MSIRETYYRSLREDQSSYGGSMFFRPDTSGIRGKGVNRKAYQTGDDKFPYGKAQPSWGQPHAYSRDSAGHGPSLQSVPVPKGVPSDDERWIDGMDGMDEIDGVLNGTPMQGNIVSNPPRSRSKFGVPDEKDDPWLDKTAEAMGVPFNVAKAGQGTGGQHTGGRVHPGTSGQWSARPKGNPWDNAVTDDDLERAGKGEGPFRRQDEYNYGLPFQGNIMKRSPEMSVQHPEDDDIIAFHIPTDDETKDTDTIDARMKQVGGAKFTQTPGHSLKYSRMQPGFTWKENYHYGLIEAFVSMKDTPAAPKQCSHSMHDVDLDFAKNTFMDVHGTARKQLDTMDEPSLVKFLIQIEPEHFMKSLGEIGKDKLLGIYETWASDVLTGEGMNIERMSERIMKAIGGAGHY